MPIVSEVRLARVKTWWNPRPMHQTVQAGIRRNLHAAASILHSEITTSISIQGAPTAPRSAPGEPPRKETKDLIESWYESTVNIVETTWTCYLISDLGYSYILEVGAPAVNLAPRPYIARAQLVREAEIY